MCTRIFMFDLVFDMKAGSAFECSDCGKRSKSLVDFSSKKYIERKLLMNCDSTVFH